MGASYVIAHRVMERLAARYTVAGGLEYVVLGWVLGPRLGVLPHDVVQDVRPVLLLGVGALGLLAGLELGRTRAVPRRTWAAAVVIAAATIACVGGVPLLVTLGGRADLAVWSAGAGALLAAGVVVLGTDASSVRSVAARLGAAGSTLELGVAVAGRVRALAIVAFGAFFALFVPDGALSVRGPLAAAEAFAVQVGAGVGLGVLFGLLTRQRLDERTRLALIVGMVLVAGGFAYALGVSAIFVNFIMGLTLGRVSGQAPAVLRTIRSIEQPFVIALYFFAGLEWITGIPWTFALVVPLLVLRQLGRRVGGWIGARLTGAPFTLGPATLAPGGLSLAFLLSIGLVYREVPGIANSYGPLLAAVVLLEFLAPRVARRWVLDVADTLERAEGG